MSQPRYTIDEISEAQHFVNFTEAAPYIRAALQHIASLQHELSIYKPKEIIDKRLPIHVALSHVASRKLLRVVKRERTVRKICNQQGNVTIFLKSILGYKNDGATVLTNYILDRFYEVYQGTFTDYPFSLKENHKVELYIPKPKMIINANKNN